MTHYLGTYVSTATKRVKSPSQPTGQWIRAEKRLAIYLRDAFLCIYCTRDLHDADPRDVTLDHIKPKVDGGSNHETNLITACRACNCSRQDKPVSRFASPEARAHIKRNTRRSLTKYLKLAKALISGETGFEQFK
jgi:5-methylcytosine-specific restriction endonuclease McrA